ncbi:DUF3822 family protein [Costertonia aggregata]|uniref:DUF3822 family protein n=1 Tax=Costertonia aggregata TaxID=343403 RepID=A0A7H9ASP1_9FLAO|nr:DUF3822 family protein [Costertonia aggregata]QLG46473.1 DUF3822 family protein [Costertonia aggregata]
MTKKETNNIKDETISDYQKLSIQVSLDGLSFCVLDTIGNTILASERIIFDNELNPYGIQKELKGLFNQHDLKNTPLSEIVVIHKNTLFSLVPKSLFDENELANYLKFNTKLLANDHLDYDEIENYDVVNVYVPFVNINNYIYELFGEFEFKHHSTVLIETLLNNHSNGNEPVCYVHVSKRQFDVTVISQKKLVFHNTFEYTTREDFIYYLLFTLEQLNLDTETVPLKLFGAVEEGDSIYNICYTYVKHITIFIPSFTSYHLGDLETETIDFTVLNAL